MPDNASLTPENASAVIDTISRSVCEAMIAIQQQHLEWLNEGYKNHQWTDPNVQTGLIKGLTFRLNQASDTATIIQKVKEYLEFFLEPDFFSSSEFTKLEENIRSLIEKQKSPPKEIAILLLDVENLQIDEEIEKKLQDICKYPIQIKIAFAHWNNSNMRGQDATFSSRNYDLRHVPPGENSADIQMSTYGASVLMRYPNVREVFVCSSDRGLQHLSNELHSQGLTVYQVIRKGQRLSIVNQRIGETTSWIMPLSLEEFISKVKSLIRSDRANSPNSWITLSKLSQVYQHRYHLSFAEAIANYAQCESAKEFFINHPHHFATHQLPGKKELYISLFNGDINAISVNKNNSKLPPIESSEALEKTLIEIINILAPKAIEGKVDIARVGSEFTKKYGETVSDVIGRLGLNTNFKGFLQSCKGLAVEQVNGSSKVAIAKS